MTRTELAKLKEANSFLDPAAAYRAWAILHGLILDAEREFAAEDEYHDAAEADAIPVNLEAA